MKNTIADNVKLLTLWRNAVNREETMLGLGEWVRLYHPALADPPIADDPPPAAPAHWQAVSAAMQQDVDVLAVRLDDLERDVVSPETVSGMIDVQILKLEQRIRDAFVCASRSISP